MEKFGGHQTKTYGEIKRQIKKRKHSVATRKKVEEIRKYTYIFVKEKVHN